jgi:hypothetical protein
VLGFITIAHYGNYFYLFICLLIDGLFCGPGSSVGIATDYGLDGPGIESRWGRDFPRPCPDRPSDPPSLLYNGYRVFPGGEVRPGRAADHSPPSSATVVEELYFYPPSGQHQACNGVTLPLPLPLFVVYFTVPPVSHNL